MSQETIKANEILKANKSDSYFAIIRKQFLKNKLAVGAFIVLVFIILLCIFVPIFSPYSMYVTIPDQRFEPPSARHWFGTDIIGRDLFTRLFYAGRISLGIALAATAITTIIGVVLGSISGFYGKWVDQVVMRITEMVLSMPFFMIAIVIVALFGSSIPTLIATFSLLSWPGICRIVRGQILMLREMDYMVACEALGIRNVKRIMKHLLPNLLAYVIVYATLSMASVILAETGLSFLGLGVSPPTPTWGNLLEPAQEFIHLVNRPWVFIPSGIMIFLTVMCFNIVGDGLRDAIDPKNIR